jgi:hypothetical protein
MRSLYRIRDFHINSNDVYAVKPVRTPDVGKFIVAIVPHRDKRKGSR